MAESLIANKVTPLYPLDLDYPVQYGRACGNTASSPREPERVKGPARPDAKRTARREDDGPTRRLRPDEKMTARLEDDGLTGRGLPVCQQITINKS